MMPTGDPYAVPPLCATEVLKREKEKIRREGPGVIFTDESPSGVYFSPREGEYRRVVNGVVVERAPDYRIDPQDWTRAALVDE